MVQTLEKMAEQSLTEAPAVTLLSDQVAAIWEERRTHNAAVVEAGTADFIEQLATLLGIEDFDDTFDSKDIQVGLAPLPLDEPAIILVTTIADRQFFISRKAVPGIDILGEPAGEHSWAITLIGPQVNECLSTYFHSRETLIKGCVALVEEIGVQMFVRGIFVSASAYLTPLSEVENRLAAQVAIEAFEGSSTEAAAQEESTAELEPLVTTKELEPEKNEAAPN